MIPAALPRRVMCDIHFAVSPSLQQGRLLHRGDPVDTVADHKARPLTQDRFRAEPTQQVFPIRDSRPIGSPDWSYGL